MKEESRLVGCLDIGTTKCIAVIGEIGRSGSMRVLAQGRSVSRGVSQGQIVDVDLAVQSVKEAVSELVRIYHNTLPQFLVTVSGVQVQGRDCSGVQPIRGLQVTDADIREAEQLALGNLDLDSDERIVKSRRVSYSYRNNTNVEEVLGQNITRFTLNMHAAVADAVTCDNLVKTVRRSSLEEAQLIPHGWASAYAVLTPEERYNGAVVIDIGAETTDICVMKGNQPRYTKCIASGGNEITRHLAGFMHCSMAEAEQIKQRLDMRMLPETESSFITVTQEPTGAPAQFSLYELSSLVCNQYFTWVIDIYQDLLDAGWFKLVRDQHGETWPTNHQLPAGVVITGGGSLIPQADFVFQNQAGPFRYSFATRCGSPLYNGDAKIGLTSAKESAVMGLLSYAADEFKAGRDVLADDVTLRPTLVSRVKGVLKRFLVGDF